LLGNQIEDALAKGDSNAARKLVPEFLVEPRLPADTLLRTGVSLAEHDLYPEAANVFGRCVKDFPQLFEGYYNLALAELALRKYSEALATLAKAPSSAESGELARTYLRGKIETALGKNAEAERDLAAAFAAAPREENYALDLGLYYIRAQKYHRALAVFQKATSFRKDSPFLQLGLGLAQYLGGQSAESIETCRALLAVQPDFSPARVMMAFALYMQGKIEEAERTAAQGLRGPTPFAYLFYVHAVSLIKLQSQDYGLMLNDRTVAARAIPQCSLCYLAMSKVHQRKGDRRVATADLEIAVGLDPSFAEAWYRLAALYEQTGQPEAARQARQRFEMLKENNADRETEMLRDVFLKSLGGEGSPR
jgi:tetratricopeptide (TPR) repeat protein